MYLEISDRQTGKSTRLINQIIADEQKYDTQILFSLNQLATDYLLSKHKCNKLITCTTVDSFNHILKGFDINNTRLYVDEFLLNKSFCKNFNIMIKNPYMRNLIANGYFVSSLYNNNLFVLDELRNIQPNIVKVAITCEL